MAAGQPSPPGGIGNEARSVLGVRQVAIIGIAAIVGGGIFSVLGAAAQVAGSAVWIAFLIAAAIAGLQGYSFAKLGARYPTPAGMLEYITQGFGQGHLAAISAWLVFATNVVLTSLVAVAFGEYASGLIFGGNKTSILLCAAAVIVLMTAVNVAGPAVFATTQSLVAGVVVVVLAFFSVVTLARMKPALLAPSSYPSLRSIVAGAAIAFFAYLGFGIVTFAAKDLPRPAEQLPKALFIALSVVTALYVAVAIGVFGTLPVAAVIRAKGAALAVAAQPDLGRAGFVLISIAALFSTAGATNGGLYPVAGVSRHLAANRVFPPLLGRDLRQRANVGLLLAAGISLVLALSLDLTAIASMGSAVALLVFGLITVGHLRVRRATGARLSWLIVAVATLGAVLLAFLTDMVTTDLPATAALIAIVGLAVALDLVWSRMRRDDTSARPLTVME